jgi:hypothetical protein
MSKGLIRSLGFGATLVGALLVFGACGGSEEAAPEAAAEVAATVEEAVETVVEAAPEAVPMEGEAMPVEGEAPVADPTAAPDLGGAIAPVIDAGADALKEAVE